MSNDPRRRQLCRNRANEKVVYAVGCLNVARNTSPIGVPPPNAGTKKGACDAIREGVHGGVESAKDHREGVDKKNCTKQCIESWRDDRWFGRRKAVDMCEKEESDRNAVGGVR